MSLVDAAPNFSLHCFSSEISAQQYRFDILKMKDSLFVYVSPRGDNCLDDIALAIVHPQSNITTSIQILGEDQGDSSRNLVHHLSKRLGKNIYLSLNVENNSSLHMRIEQQLYQEINNNFDKF